MKKFIFILGAAVILLMAVALVLFLIYADNTTIGITQYSVRNEKIPAGFEGYKIVQVADLHNTEFGENNEELLSLIAQCEPDIIVFTGDQVDARKTDLNVVVEFAKQAVQIAPCYLVTGNHEGSIIENRLLSNQLKDIGVNVLENAEVTLQCGGDSLSLIGVSDPSTDYRSLEIGQAGAMDEVLAKLCKNTGGYTILLSHHPEFLELYYKYDAGLVLSGHAHGGQIRIKDQGIIAPHQGLLPQYDGGEYSLGNTTMILSRGLGNSLFPWRINNPPELVLVELHTEG